MIRKVDFTETKTLNYIYSIITQLDNTDMTNVISDEFSYEDFIACCDSVYIYTDEASINSIYPKINGLICIRRYHRDQNLKYYSFDGSYSIEVLYVPSWISNHDKYNIVSELIKVSTYDKKDLPVNVCFNALPEEVHTAIEDNGFVLHYFDNDIQIYTKI